MASPTDVSNAGQPMFTPISHPELRRLGRKPVHTFLKERKKYLLQVADAINAGSNVTPVTLRSSIDRDLLESLISLKTFEGVESFEDLTDAKLEGFLLTRDDVKVESISLQSLETSVKSCVKINVHEADAEMRIMSLFSDYRTHLRNKKCERLIDDSPKVAIQHVTTLLKPAVLKHKIEQDIKLNVDGMKEDWFKFYAKVLKRAIDVDEYVPANSDCCGDCKPRSSSDNGKSDKKNAKSSSGPRHNGGTSSNRKLNDSGHSHEHKGKDSNDGKGGSEPSSSTEELPDCLNSECHGKHLLKDCPITPDELKKQLLKEYHNSKRKSRMSTFAVRPKPITNHRPPPAPARATRKGIYSGRLADVVEVEVNGDYGSDHAALSEEHLDQLAKAGVYVSVLPLTTPIEMGLAIESGIDTQQAYVAHKKARISITVETCNGPFRFRNLPFLVFKEHLPEVLLSRPLLDSIGFDLDVHLAKVRETFHDADFSHIGFSADLRDDGEPVPTDPSRLSRLLLQDSADQFADQHDKEPSTVPSPLFYGDTVGDDPVSFDEPIETGVDNSHSTRQYLSTMVNDAIDQGLPEAYHNELRDLVHEYCDIFRTKLGGDPPARITPMKVILKKDAEPIRVKVRRYSPPQAVFLRSKVDELQRAGLVRPNNQSRWAYAPLIVPKPGPEKYRFTVDLRPVNSQTEPHPWPMPDLETIATQLAGDTCYATLDLCQGYWQMPLEEASQECQSFITPDGVFSPTRVLHVATNAVSFFQSTLQQICRPIRDQLLQWIDDLQLHCKTVRDLLNELRKIFTLFRKHNLKLNAKKCRLFLKSVKWCGRIISADGIRFDPARFDSLLELQEPQTGADLQQFVCAANWMRTAIPRFNQLIAPLAATLEKVYEICGKRTRKAASRVPLTSSLWDKTTRQAFQDIKEALHNSATLAHPDASKTLCLFTDASQHFWSGVLTQIPRGDIDKPFEDQRHEPLSFLSGSFKGSRYNWSTPEKEAFAIVESVTRLDYMLLRPEGFTLFTDHKNLTFIFNPLSIYPKLSKHVANKIERWAMKLTTFNYTIIHIPGDDNVWADLLSRWGAIDNGNRSHARSEVVSGRISTLFVAPLAPNLDPDFTWPTTVDIIHSQRTSPGTPDDPPPTNVHRCMHCFDDGAIWIPAADTKMQLRLCIIAHCGRGGHRGATTTYENIRDHYRWKGMKSDVLTFCNTCLHCQMTTGGTRVPRPMGHALHSDTSNEVIHFDFLYIFEGDDGYEYILILKDDASSFVWLEPCRAADAKHVTDLLLRWFASFGVALTWVSDRGTHFKNQIMTALNRALHAHHHFTTPYCPQSNGTVETVCKEVLRALRALLSELRLLEVGWEGWDGDVKVVAKDFTA